MRHCHVFVITFLSQFAIAQIQTGTVIVLIHDNNVVTVAADSRIFETGTRKQDNTHCKIATFGNYFVFAMSGTPRNNRGWDAYDTARDLWSAQSKKTKDPFKLVDSIADKWAETAELHFKTKESVESALPTLESGNVLDSALFVATSPSGGLKVKEIDFLLDVGLYRTGEIKVSHQPKEEFVTGSGAIGRSEIIREFMPPVSNRAKKYMGWYLNEISKLQTNQHDAALAAKLVELTVLLHPTAQDFLDFPIDELQITDGKAVRWLHQKQSCKSQPADTLPKK